MANGFASIESALSSLRAFRKATEVISHNIANANTDGFSRQDVRLTAIPNYERAGWGDSVEIQIGRGVNVDSVRRARNPFLDTRIRTLNADVGRFDVIRQSLSRTERSIGEPSPSGLSAQFDGFFRAWQDVANNPQNLAARSAVIQRAQSLTAKFNEVAGVLRAEQETLDQQVQAGVDEVNQLLTQIADLNGRIRLGTRLGDQPNDLRDQRDRALDRLSRLVNISYVEETDTTVTVRIGPPVTGRIVVTETTVNSIEAFRPTPSSFLQVRWNDPGPPAGQVTITSEITGGEIGGALFQRDDVNDGLANKINRLNTLATQVITSVNALHTAGFTIETPPAAGLPLLTGTNAATINVNAAVVNDPRRIAASNASGVAGNNQIALQMTALQQQNHGALNDSSFNEFWGTMVTDFGFETNMANNQFLSRRFLYEQIDADRQSVSGVSLDEEAANLMRYQRSYEAAARIFTAIDDMIDRVINGMGLVGR